MSSSLISSDPDPAPAGAAADAAFHLPPAWASAWALVAVLWQRDLKRLFRQPSRLIGALGQPVIFWGIIGSGYASTFALPGADVSYASYFYGGVIMMVALFSSIFASVSVIEDRHQGFLLHVLTVPAPRFALVLGKCLGSASVAGVQISLFLLLAPVAGYSWLSIDWPSLLLALSLACVGLSALGFAVAWRLDNVQAYHAVQMTLLVPLWVISGAMFPGPKQGAYATAMRLNPLSYAVSAIRHALSGGQAPAATVLADRGTSLAVLASFCVLSLCIAQRQSARRV